MIGAGSLRLTFLAKAPELVPGDEVLSKLPFIIEDLFSIDMRYSSS
jgi:hypothetical protein